METTATVVFELVIPAKARLTGALELIVDRPKVYTGGLSDSASYASIEKTAMDILCKIGTGVDIKCISIDDSEVC
jgi:hypothetical protein